MKKSTRAGEGNAGRLNISVTADRLACFFPLLQKGFTLEVSLGCPIRALLRDQLGVPEPYIETRIQTVFLDGKPVDDIDTALVGDGATLALAPAMPGLMGAMLRRGGYYAPMRSGITHRDDTAEQPIGKGRIVVKLFGSALRDLGPKFLERGVQVDAGDLAKVVKGLPEGCGERPGDREALADQGGVILQVNAPPPVTGDQ
jgi:hypothetical protein